MAAILTPQWSNSYSPQVRLTVNAVNASSSVTSLNWTLEYVGHGYPPHTTGGRAYSVVIAGETVGSGSYDINGKTGTYTIASGTKQVTRQKSNQNISFSVSFAFNLTWSGVYGGTKSASGSVTVQARSSNTYSFNANGGSGAPSAATKWGGIDFTFPTGKPSRTGYEFNGWYNSDINSGTLYQPGQAVHDLPDQAVTWYASWTANTFTVTYNANYGTDAPAAQTKAYDVDLTLSSTQPTRENCIFLGWGTAPLATTVAYAPGATYSANASITLYAMWRQAYEKPSIENVKVDRCNSDGVLNDDGTYFTISFDWKIDAENSGGLKSIQVSYKLSTNTTWTNYPITSSGTSGSVTNKVYGLGLLSTENPYDVKVTVTDNKNSSEYIALLPATKYIIDFSPQGGVGFGRPAPAEQTVSFNVPMVIDGINMFFKSGFGMYFQDTEGENSMSLVRGTSVDQQLIWTLNQLYIAGTLALESHLYLNNNAGVAGKMTAGSYFSMLKMNDSDQVELNWTSGGLRGRVRKQLWAGTWSSGSLTLAEVPFYNMFLIAFSGGTEDDSEDGYLIANRNAAGTRISGIGAVIGGTGNSPRIVCCDIMVSGSTLTYSGLTMNAITASVGAFNTGRKIRRIVGLF